MALSKKRLTEIWEKIGEAYKIKGKSSIPCITHDFEVIKQPHAIYGMSVFSICRNCEAKREH